MIAAAIVGQPLIAARDNTESELLGCLDHPVVDTYDDDDSVEDLVIRVERRKGLT